MNTQDTTTTLEAYVAGLFNVNTSALFSRTRRKGAVSSRQVCWLMMKYFTEASSVDMGDYFNHDHATVLHNLRKAEEHYKREKDFAVKVDAVYEKCRTQSLEMPFTWVNDDDYDWSTTSLDEECMEYENLRSC